MYGTEEGYVVEDEQSVFLLLVQIYIGWRACADIENLVCVEGVAKIFFRVAHQQNIFIWFFEGEGFYVGDVEKADGTDGGRGWNLTSASFVIEGDVARDHGQLKRVTRFGHSLYRVGEFSHDFRVFGVPKIETVRDSQGCSANTDEVSACLCDSLL